MFQLYALFLIQKSSNSISATTALSVLGKDSKLLLAE